METEGHYLTAQQELGNMDKLSHWPGWQGAWPTFPSSAQLKRGEFLSHLSFNCKGHWGTTNDFQPVSSIFPCSPLPSRTWRTPGLSILWCCLPTFSPVCLVFLPLSLCLARWFWTDLMNGRHDHTTAVCVSLRWSEGLRVVRLPAGFWHELPCW